MATEAAIPINTPRDTVQRIHRTTREKRSLWYQLTVLQQPERARACGAGSKAHSDRRPVDPPPVVELRIIEGESADTGKDITFDYNANFFLFASLENSRPIAHGRVQTAAAQSPPILTGVPCSGMAYLDRPISAGYFIFPDLSIRHEGNYVLNFNLFETTKEEKDFDLDPAEPDLPLGVDFRMEIRTNPFQVYSAKKFPGLMESTQLSKTVADQGCRVRIRRDVRMRKRDGKSNNYNSREESFVARQPKAVTPAPEDPHAAALRARSLSNSSEHRVPYGPDAHRRPSAADVYAAPPPPGYEPAAAANRGHLAFGDPNAAQYAAPRQPMSQGGPQLAPVSPVGPYTPNGHPTPAHSTYQPSRPLSRAGHGSVAPMGQEGYERRPGNHPTPSPTVYSSVDHRSRRDSGASYPPTPISHHSPRIPLPHNAYPPQAPRAQPMKISSMVTHNMNTLPPIEAQTEPDIPPPNIATGGKRKHELTFYQSITPLHNGQRQQDPHYDERRRIPPIDLHAPVEARWTRADGSEGVTLFNRFC